MASFGRINLKYTTYEEIINNGDFNILTNDSIRSLIIETNNLYKDITSRENFYEDFYHSLILPYIMDNFDIINNKAINNSIVNKVEFKNPFALNIGIKQQTVSSYQMLYEKLLLLETLLIK